MPYGYGDHMDNGGWGAGWIAMLIVMLVFLVRAAVVVWFLLSGSRRSIGGSSAEPSRPTPEQVLSEVGRLDRRLRARARATAPYAGG